MYVEENNTAKRKCLNQDNSAPYDDVIFLKHHFQEHGCFPLFTQVLIETRTDCNCRCQFCPQAYFSRPLKIMEWSVFTKVIDQLAAMGFSGRIALYMTNEPLLESRLLEMVKYARSKSPRFFLDFTTNGIHLSAMQIDKLFIAGLDNININDYPNDREKYPDMISSPLKNILSNFRSNPKLTYNKRSTFEILSNYAGIVPGAKREIKNSFCNYPFRKLAISADGNIILCCNDYTYKTNFGNVSDKSLKEVWFSNEVNQYRNDLLSGPRKGICKDCDEFQNYSVFS